MSFLIVITTSGTRKRCVFIINMGLNYSKNIDVIKEKGLILIVSFLNILYA